MPEEIFKFDISAFKDLEKLLKQLPEPLAKKALEDAARAGANLLRREIRARAPQGEGKLKRNILVKKNKRTKYAVNYKVGVAGKIYYAHFIEFGTSPHLIAAKRKKLLTDGQEAFGKEVQHPGQSARPFLRPAVDAKGQEAIATFGQKLSETVLREATKLASSLNLNLNRRGRRR